MEQSKESKHFVLVHGACMGGWCWYKVKTILKAAGHHVTAPDLGASGVHPKQHHELSTISDYLEPLTEVMEAIPPDERVVLVGHSMGGVAISVAMERFPHKISVAVFVLAYMPGPYFSDLEITDKFNMGSNSAMDSKYGFANGSENPPTSFLFGPKYLSYRMFQLSSPEDLTLGAMLARPFPSFYDEKSIEETTLTKENYGTVRRVYIMSAQDNGLKEEMQKWLIESNPPDEVMRMVDSDHMVMCSQPQQLCSYLLAIADKYNK